MPDPVSFTTTKPDIIAVPTLPPAVVTTQGRVTEIVAPSDATNVVTKTLDKALIPNWRLMHKLWTVRIAIFWAIICGLWVALPAFDHILPPLYFALLCIGFSLSMLFARITNQPGVTG
jgi:uncharacterized membrane protein YbhN (UPF0104 family)